MSLGGSREVYKVKTKKKTYEVGHKTNKTTRVAAFIRLFSFLVFSFFSLFYLLFVTTLFVRGG